MTFIVTGPTTNFGTTNQMLVFGRSFAGNVVNAGLINGGATGILVENNGGTFSSINGALINRGTISVGADGIVVFDSIVTSGIFNTGGITAVGVGIAVVD